MSRAFSVKLTSAFNNGFRPGCSLRLSVIADAELLTV